MKYFVCLAFFLLLAFAVFLWQRAKRNLKCALLKNFFRQHYDFEQTNTLFSLFADDIFEIAAQSILSADMRTKNKIFKNLKSGNEDTLFAFLKTQEQPIEKLLKALSGQKLISGKTQPARTASSKLALALIGESQFQYGQLDELLSKLPSFPCNKSLRRLKKLLNARRLLFKTDLKKASEILIRLAKVYQKDDDALKTAYVYFMLGQVYRLAKAFDVAQMMFEKSLRIYKHLSHAYGQHLILSELGLNALMQNLFDDAHAYLKKAHSFYTKHQSTLLEANILTWQSCCHLGQNNSKKARYTAGKAFKLHQRLGSRAGMAFSLELKAAAFLGDHNHKMAESCTKSALKHYHGLQNRTAELKMLDMLTKIQLDANQIPKAKRAFNIFCKHQKKYNLPFFEDTAYIKETLYPPKTENR